MDPYKQFATDAVLVEEGAWFDIGDGGRLRIARAGNRRFREQLRELSRGKERRIARGLLSEDEALDIYVAALARAVLVDWEGLTEHGEALAYTPEKAEALLREIPTFRKLLEGCAGDIDGFRPRDSGEPAEAT